MYNRKSYTNHTHVFGWRVISSPRHERRAGSPGSKLLVVARVLYQAHMNAENAFLGQYLHTNIAPLESTEYLLTADLT